MCGLLPLVGWHWRLLKDRVSDACSLGRLSRRWGLCEGGGDTVAALRVKAALVTSAHEGLGSWGCGSNVVNLALVIPALPSVPYPSWDGGEGEEVDLPAAALACARGIAPQMIRKRRCRASVGLGGVDVGESFRLTEALSMGESFRLAEALGLRVDERVPLSPGWMACGLSVLQTPRQAA